MRTTLRTNDFDRIRVLSQHLGTGRYTESGTSRHRQLPVLEHERFSEVFGEPPGRGREITGQREAGQCRECEVGGAAEAGLEHPAAPHGHARGAADVVDPYRLEQ